MTKNQRIVLNTVVSYGRTVLSMCLGLFSSRWVLMGLGVNDFGLFGVVGGIMTFVTILNSLLASSVSRYYAHAIGEAAKDHLETNENLERWFNSALSIHWFLPIALIAIGYPVGVYAVEHWLQIPEGREMACIWVLRLSMLTAFFNMVSVPYIAMYQAKQLIAELSIWSVATTITNFGIAYWMLSYSGDRFIMYAFLSAIMPSLILAIQVWRGRAQFVMCRLRVKYMFDWMRLKKIFAFAFWDAFGWVGMTVRDNGSVLVLNHYYGSSLNAAYSLAQRVISYTTSLSSSINGALQPAITTAVGEGNLEEAQSLSFKSCKYATLMILFFAIPVIVEIDELLYLWLGEPPAYTADLCRLILVSLVLQHLGWGHQIIMVAIGRIGLLQFILATICCLGLVIMIALIWLGAGPMSIGYMLIIVFALMMVTRVLFARCYFGLSLRYWAFKVCVPVLFVGFCSYVSALGFSTLFSQSFIRALGTGCVSSIVLIGLSTLLVLGRTERELIINKIKLKFL